MEMENSRRSIDRSREPGLKKPRLVEDVERDRSSNGIIDRGDRSFPSRVSAGAATGPQGSRFRTNDREGDAYHPQQQQQHQELVSRYKTALAELTFNSKPIITNLTIIAGENLHAAKWIAATVCANILEVPSEQKLPSLYLLDSIVKNIGRDYIKYFAARLPEVFCKAYRQVDPSIHPGMRHLFGTWKGVFPIACLQSIEKELGFPPATNGSSSGAATSRADSQAQRPPHSIHVNPKYLEARQRLQQSSRDFKQPQREVSREPVIEKSNSTDFEDYEYSSDFSRHSDLGFGRVDEKVTEQEEIDKPWYGAGKNATEAAADQRNALGGQREFSKYRAPKPVPPVAKLPPAGLTTNAGKRSSTAMNRNWKNSEEEEYMWDDMNSRLTDHGGPGNSRKDGWNTDDAEKLEVEDHFMQPRGEPDTGSRTSRESSADSYSIAQRGQLFGHRPSMLLMREPQTEDSLKHTGVSSTVSAPSEVQCSSLGVFSASIGSSVARTGRQTNMQLSVGDVPSFGSFMNIGSSGGGLAQQRHQPPYPISPSRHQSVQQNSHLPSSSALRQQQVSHNFTELDHLQDSSMSQSGQKASQIAGQLNRAPPMQTNQEPFPTITKSKPVNLQNLQPTQIPLPRNIQTAPMHFPQQRNHSSFSQQSHSELRQSQPFGQIQKHLPHTTFGTPESGHSMSDHSSNPATDVPGQSSTGSLLAAIMKSGLLSNNSVSGGITNVSFQESGTVPPHLNIQPPLPSGPPPAQLATSTSMVAPISLPASHGRTSPKTDPQRTAVLPPLPPGPPPSSSILGSSQTGGATNSESNPLSSLLSSLVAKGLISKPAKEPTSITASEVPSMPQNQNSSIPTSSSMLVSLVPASSTIPQPSSGKEPPLSETAAKGTTASSQVIAMEKKGLIGIEFKPEVIRESHPGVISDLLADLLHRCDICGLRLKLQERLDRHLEWHASKKHDSSGNNNNTMSRRWYASLDNWVTGSAGCPYPTTEGLVKIEENEPMVPADETQAVCVLCGELFEDFYSHERDEWMYKGAVYMTIPVSDVGAMDDSSGQGPIVHDKCISPSSAYDLGLAKNVGKGNAEG